MAIALCCMAYLLVFGKTLDWFDSPKIRLDTAGMLVSTGVFLLVSVRNGDDAYPPSGYSVTATYGCRCSSSYLP